MTTSAPVGARILLLLALTGACTVAAAAAGGTLTAVAPSGATPGITIQISGTGLSAVAAENEVTFLPAAGGAAQTLPATSATILDPATGRGRVLVRVPAGLPVGPAALRVTNRATGEASEGRTLQVIEIALGAVRSAKADGGAVEIEVTGSSNTAFVAGATRVVLGAGITVGTVNVDSPTRLRVSITVARGAAPGTRTLAFNTSQQMGTLPDVFTVLEPAANVPPVAKANGPYTGLAGADILFSSAGSSDPDGDPITFEWTFGDGGSSTAANPVHRYGAPGTYDIVLTVRDNQGHATSATTKATVTALPNQGPVADAGGPYSGQTTQPVAFSGLGSKDPDGDLLIFAWDFGDGFTGVGPSPDHAYFQPGIYTVTLLVSDGKGGTDTAQTIARVSTPAPGNQPPRAAIGGPYTVTVNEPLTLSAAGSSDPDNDALAYAWTFGDGEAGTGVSPVHTYQTVGTYTATVLVTDGRGGGDTAQAEVVVTPAPVPQNQPPVARAGDDVQVKAGVVVPLDGSASSDPDNDPLTFAWSFGDGASAGGPAAGHAYSGPGTYTVTLLVTDGRGGAATDTLTVTVTVDQANRPPTASIAGPGDGETGQSLAFSAVASDPDNDPLAYAWDFEDGTGNGASLSHAWPLAGKYTVTLTVTDGRGGIATATQAVTITAPPTTNSPPLADAGGPYGGQQNAPIAFDGSKSSDADNDPLSYAWSFGDSATGTGVAPTHSYAQAGTYNVTLVVSDPSGATSTATAQVVVTGNTPVNRPPTARPGGPYSTATGIGVPFDGSASSDPDNDPLTFSWDFGDQSPKGSGPSPVHAYVAPGVYTVTLTVTDLAGASDGATTTVTIAAPADRSPPNVTLSAPKFVLPGAQVTATAKAVDNVAVSNVRFEVENNVPSDTAIEPYQRTFSVPAFATPGQTILVRAIATDPSNNTGQAEATVTVTVLPDTEPPVVALSGPPQVTAGAVMRLVAAATDNVGVASVTFFAGPDAIGTVQTPPYEIVYAVPPGVAVGTQLPFTARAVDFSGNTGEGTAAVPVVDTPDEAPPRITLTAPAQVSVGAALQLSAVATDDVGVASVTFFVNGVPVATDTQAPYTAEAPFPAGTNPGGVIAVTATAVDFANLSASDGRSVLVVAPPAISRGVIAGEVYDDTTGLPLAGVTVTLTGKDLQGKPYDQQATTDARGRYLLRGNEGNAVVVVTKAGWTRVDRPIAVVAARAIAPFDARLTPLAAAVNVSPITGGQVGSDAARLDVPVAALQAPAAIAVTPISQQGLQGLLPAGWTPVGAADVTPHGATFTGVASLTLANRFVLPQGTVLTIVTWNEAGAAWRVVSSATIGADGALTGDVPGTGQFAWLLADGQPLTPPSGVGGALLAGVEQPVVPDPVDTVVTPQPKVLFYQPGVHSDVRATITAPAPFSSGARLWARISETYTYYSGGQANPDPYVQDLVFYQVPSAPTVLAANYPVGPSLTFEALSLEQGVIGVDVFVPAAGDTGAQLVSSDGGVVAGPGGESLVLPPGAVADATPFDLATLAADGLGLTLPPELAFAGGVEVAFTGALGAPASLAVPKPQGYTSADALRSLLVRLQELGGQTRLVLVGLARLNGDALASDLSLGGQATTLEGVRVPGRYLFVRLADAVGPIGFAEGHVIAIGGGPFTGALVSSGLPVVSLSRADGAYFAVGRAGSTTFTATDLAKFDEGTGTASVLTARAVPLEIALTPQPPRVTSLTPANDAAAVPLSDALVAVFSEPIDPATATPDNVQLATSGGEAVGGSIALSNNNTKLTFRAAAPLAPATRFTFTLTQGIKDLSGYGLDKAYATAFTSLDTNPPPHPPAGSLNATIPDANGESVVTATQGTVGLHDRVTIVNLTKGSSTPVLVEPDGSFRAVVQAGLGDRLKLQITGASGTETVVDLPRFRRTNADGSVSEVIGPEGGHVDGPGGIAADVPAGAFDAATIITLAPVSEAEFPVKLDDHFRTEWSYTAGIRLDLGGVTPNIYLNLSVPPPPGATIDDSWAVTQVFEVDGVSSLAVVDTASLIKGRVTTSSPPCPGVTGSGMYGFLRTARPLGVVYTSAQTRSLPGAALAPFLVPMPGVFRIPSVALNYTGIFDLLYGPQFVPPYYQRGILTGGLEDNFAPFVSGLQAALSAAQPICLPLLSGRITIGAARIEFGIPAASVQAGDRELTVTNSTRRTVKRFYKPFPPLISIEGAPTDSVTLQMTNDLGVSRVFTPDPPEAVARPYTKITVERTEFQPGDQAISVVNEARNIRFGSSLSTSTRPGVDLSVIIEGEIVDPYRVDVTGADGTVRQVPWISDVYDVGNGNLVVQALPGTIDPTKAEIDAANAGLPPEQQIKGAGVKLVRLISSSDLTPNQSGQAWTILDASSSGPSRVVNGGFAMAFSGSPLDRYLVEVQYEDGKAEEIEIPIFRIQVIDQLTKASSQLIAGQVPPRGQPLQLPSLTDPNASPAQTSSDQLSVDPGDPISFSVDEPVDALSITNLAMVDASGQPVAGAWSVGDDKKTLTFAPVAPLRLGQQYRLSLLGLRTASGRRVALSGIDVLVFKPWKIGTQTLEGLAGTSMGEKFPVKDIVLLDRPGAASATIPYWVAAASGNRMGFKVHVSDVTNPTSPVEISHSGAGYFVKRLAKVQGTKADYPVYVFHDVQLIPQSNSMSCWAASMAMILGWRDKRTITDADFASGAGFLTEYFGQGGWDLYNMDLFTKTGMVVEPPQSYSVDKFKQLLETYGPLWVASKVPGIHARVVQGLIGDGTPDGTFVFIKDPWQLGMRTFALPNSGAEYAISYTAFTQEIEALATYQTSEWKAICGYNNCNSCITGNATTAACTTTCLAQPTPTARAVCLAANCANGYESTCNSCMTSSGCLQTPAGAFVAHLPTPLPPSTPVPQKLLIASASNTTSAFTSILDVTNPYSIKLVGGKPLTVNPEEVSSYNQKGTNRGIGVAKAVATLPGVPDPAGYITVTENGLFAINITKNVPEVLPADRQLEGFYPGDFHDVVAVGSQLVVLDNQFGGGSNLDLFDANLGLVTSLPLPDAGRHMVFAPQVPSDRDGDGKISTGEFRDLIFVGGVSGITIVDATQPEAMQVIGSVSMPGIIYELAVMPSGRTLLAGGYASRTQSDGDALYFIDVSNPTKSGLLDVTTPPDGVDDRILYKVPYPNGVGGMRVDPVRGLAYVGNDNGFDVWGMVADTERFRDKLELRPVIIPMLTTPGTQQLSVWLTPGGRAGGSPSDVARSSLTTYEWVGNGLVSGQDGVPNTTELINALLDRLKKDLNISIPVRMIPADKLKVVNGALQVDGHGVQILRARRGDVTSNFSIVLAGLKLEKIHLSPLSGLSTLPGLLASAMGSDKNPPLILLPDANGFFLDKGAVLLDDATFSYLGAGSIRISELVQVIRPVIQKALTAALAGETGPAAPLLATGVLKLMGLGASYAATQLLDPLESADTHIATVTTQVPFKGLVQGRTSGVTAVTGTLSLGRFGKASDSVLVWVTPELESVAIEPQQSLIRDCSRPVKVRTFARLSAGYGTINLPSVYTDTAKFLDALLPGGLSSWTTGSIERTFRTDFPAENLRFEFSLGFTFGPTSVSINNLKLGFFLPNSPAGFTLPGVTETYDITNTAVVRKGRALLFDQEFEAADSTAVGETTFSSEGSIALLGTKRAVPDGRIGVSCGGRDLRLLPPVVMSVTCDKTEQLELLYTPGDGSPEQDVSASPDSSYQWVFGSSAPASVLNDLETLRTLLTQKLGLSSPIPIADIDVGPQGQLTVRGCGVNVIRGKYKDMTTTLPTVVLAGLKLDSIDLLPVSPLSTSVGLITSALGVEKNPPLLLTAPGNPIFGDTAYLADRGVVILDDVTFEYLGGVGKISISDLVDVLSPIFGTALTGLFAETGPAAPFLAKAVMFLTLKSGQFVASQFLKYETDPNITPPVVTVSNEFPKGVVYSRAPGITFVKGTLDLGPLGEAEDEVFTWVLPDLTTIEVEPPLTALECLANPEPGPTVRVFGTFKLSQATSFALKGKAASGAALLDRFLPGGIASLGTSWSLGGVVGSTKYRFSLTGSLAPSCGLVGDAVECAINVGTLEFGTHLPADFAPAITLEFTGLDPGVAEIKRNAWDNLFDFHVVRKASSRAWSPYSVKASTWLFGQAQTNPDPEVQVLCDPVPQPPWPVPDPTPCQQPDPRCPGGDGQPQPGSPRLVCTKKLMGDSVFFPGQTATYETYVANVGTGDATDVVLLDRQYSGQTLFDSSLLLVGTLAPGQAWRYLDAVTVPPAYGLFYNTVAIPGSPDSVALCWAGAMAIPMPWPMINEVVTQPITDWNGDGVIDLSDQWVELSVIPAALIEHWTLTFTDTSGLAVTIPVGSAFPHRDVFDARALVVINAPGGMAPGTTLTLKNELGQVVDEVTVTGTATGPDDEAFARVPNGIDTNSPADFKRVKATKGTANPLM